MPTRRTVFLSNSAPLDLRASLHGEIYQCNYTDITLCVDIPILEMGPLSLPNKSSHGELYRIIIAL